MTGLIGDLMPLILLILGVSIGLWIIASLVYRQDDLTDDEITQRIRERRFRDDDDWF